MATNRLPDARLIKRMPLMERSRRIVAAVAIGTICFGLANGPRASAGAAEKKSRAVPEEPAVRTPLAEPQRTGSLAAQYCESVRTAAGDARTAQQAAHLQMLARQLEEQAAKLDARSAQLKEWIAKRDALVQKVTEQLVGIFGAMRAESAAEQLVRLDPSTAAAILVRLDARAAGAILNDMPPDKAARLTGLIAEAARKDERAAKP